MLADHRPRQFQRVGGGCERAEFDGPDEHGHAGQAVHIENSWFRLFACLGDLSASTAPA
ncbi:hypothetical protein ACVI1J_008555 [Bradyrhizobium diazoefficiens]